VTDQKPGSVNAISGAATIKPSRRRHAGTGFWQRAVHHRSFVVGGFLSLLVLAAAALSLVWTPWSPYELDIAAIVFKSEGEPRTVLDYDIFLDRQAGHWLVREIRLKWKRVLKRIDLTARSLVALIEPGSCFAGTLAEIVFAADRSYMLIGSPDGDNRPPAGMMLGDVNLSGALAMSNGLDRLRTRFLGEPEAHDKARQAIGQTFDARAAEALGLITFALDDIDWDEEIRLFLEERASFSPDALTGLEANLRFAGPETMETKIFGRLTAWQNWIFSRPNAAAETSALKRYGSGLRPSFDPKRT